MALRYDYPFYPLGSTEPSFSITLSSASTSRALESTTRTWSGPTGRTIRVSETSGVDYHLAFGTSTVVAVSTATMLILGGVAETFLVPPGRTYIALITSSTQVSDVNVTLGYGR